MTALLPIRPIYDEWERRKQREEQQWWMEGGGRQEGHAEEGGGGVKLNKGRHTGHKRVMREWMSERREELGGGSFCFSVVSLSPRTPPSVCHLFILRRPPTVVTHNLFNALLLVAIFGTKVYLNRLKETKTVAEYHEAQWTKSSVFKLSCSVYY